MSAAHPNKPQNPAQTSTPADRKDRRLGRGLSSLIPPNSAFSAAAAAAAAATGAQPPTGSPSAPAAGAGGAPGAAAPVSPAATAQSHTHDVAPPHGMLTNIAPTAIEPNPHQPRRMFDEVSLRALAESIKANGLVQPILVRRKRDGGSASPTAPAFQLVAGERRWRAAQLAGLETMPAVIKHVAEESLLELALTENLHRSDLNPIERANAYLELIKTRGWLQEQLAERLGEPRSSVGNFLRLLDLHPDVQRILATGQLTVGHAKAILTLATQASQLIFAEAILKYDWSVRQAEQEVSRLANADPELQDVWASLLAKQMKTEDGQPAGAAASGPASEPPRPPHIVSLEEKLTRRLGTRVFIREGRKEHMGKVVIDYYCLNDFDRILDALDIERD